MPADPAECAGPAGTAFDDHRSAWADYTASPWARIRYAVVRHTLRTSLEVLGPGLRILDVGGGDAHDALPLAEAGHDVTVLDPSEPMLAAARERAVDAGARITLLRGGIEDAAGLGTFDVVLCHFLLQYRDDLRGDLSRLAGAVRPGGLLSVVAPNPASAVLSRLVRNGPEEALAELARATTRTVTFDREVRKLECDAVERELHALGCVVVGRFGGRIANDLLVVDDRKHEPDHYAALERLELALCDREPYRRIGAFWQLVARVGGAAT